MNKALLKATFKANYKVWIIMFAIMLMYSSIIISMYDPNSMEAWDSMLELLPVEILNAMNFNITEPTFLGYIAGYYYGFIIIMFPLIYSIIMGQRMIVRYVDNGSMSFLLATPISRKKIATTQAFYLFISTCILLIVTALLIALFGALMFPGELEFLEFFLLNLNTIGLFVLISSITFAASAIFNDKSQAIGFGAGIPIFFFVIDMLAGVNEKLDFLKYFTIFSLFNTDRILKLNPMIYLNISILFISGLLIYYMGIRVFMKKDLHI